MSRFIIIATGQSLTLEQVNHVKGKGHVIAISDAYKLCPWADILVSYDRKWWVNNPKALDFTGLKFSAFSVGGVGYLRPDGMPPGCNSGLYSMFIAKELGATEIYLLGLDMWGTHYFGPHPEPLLNTNERRFSEHLQQFDYWHSAMKVVNCSPNSKLIKFPHMTIQEALP